MTIYDKPPYPTRIVPENPDGITDEEALRGFWTTEVDLSHLKPGDAQVFIWVAQEGGGQYELSSVLKADYTAPVRKLIFDQLQQQLDERRAK